MLEKWSNIGERYSEVYGETVDIILETHTAPQLECTRCGKPVKVFYTVQSKESGIEHAHLGKCCYKHFK